ncbi:hypothetical protein D5086_033244 [Populus alba]|uniref:Uncharacterized protein n=1 Tax=Populus alba TaxID=43335 RepID=A0ACC4AG84_POPAL
MRSSGGLGLSGRVNGLGVGWARKLRPLNRVLQRCVLALGLWCVSIRCFDMSSSSTKFLAAIAASYDPRNPSSSYFVSTVKLHCCYRI